VCLVERKASEKIGKPHIGDWVRLDIPLAMRVYGD
jgi:hypothetical protein